MKKLLVLALVAACVGCFKAGDKTYDGFQFDGDSTWTKRINGGRMIDSGSETGPLRHPVFVPDPPLPEAPK